MKIVLIKQGKIAIIFLCTLLAFISLTASTAWAAKPAAPTNLTATAVSSRQINLSWQDNATNETVYLIERSTASGGPFTQIDYLDANTTSFSNGNLTQNTMYYYRVRCANGTTYSSYSNTTSIATLTLAEPANLTATPVSATQINLSWTDNTNYEFWYYVERSTSSAGPYSVIGHVESNAVTYTDIGRTQSTTYYYRVRAFDGTNYSLYSNIANAATFNLSAPTNLTAAGSSSTQIILTWSDNTNYEIRYDVERSISSAGPYSVIGSVGINAATYTDIGRTQSTTYYYRVRAFDGTNYSPYSNIANAATFILSAPTNLTATASSPTQIILTWSDNTNCEIRYDVERRTSLAWPYSVIGSVGINAATYTDIGRTQSITYYYQVRAFDGTNYSAYSNTANAACPLLMLSNIAASTYTIDTAASQLSTIFFTLNGPGTTTLKIVPEKQGPAGTPVYQASQACSIAGAYLFTWNGKDNTGKAVPDEAYLYTLEASDGINSVIYSPSVPTGTGNISCSQGVIYDSYRNEPLTISYSISQPARVNLYINLSGSIFKIMDSVPNVSGNYTFDWNGRSLNGSILTGGATVQCTISSLLRENAIITTGDTPKVTLLKTDPYDVQLSYGEFTRISYTLSHDANVTVTLLSPTGATITLLNGQAQAAGAHEIQWDGTDPSDTSGKKVQISQEGDYSVSIQAVNSYSNASSVAKGCLRIWR